MDNYLPVTDTSSLLPKGTKHVYYSILMGLS